MHPTQFKEDVMIDDLFVYQREKIVYCRSFFTANLKNPVFFHPFSFHVPYGTSCGTGERFICSAYLAQSRLSYAAASASRKVESRWFISV